MPMRGMGGARQHYVEYDFKEKNLEEVSGKVDSVLIESDWNLKCLIEVVLSPHIGY